WAPHRERVYKADLRGGRLEQSGELTVVELSHLFSMINFYKSLFFNDQCIFFEILADHEVFNSGASRFFARVRRVSLGWPGLMFGVVVWSAWDPFFLIFCWRLGWFGTFVGRSPYRFA